MSQHCWTFAKQNSTDENALDLVAFFTVEGECTARVVGDYYLFPHDLDGHAHVPDDATPEDIQALLDADQEIIKLTKPQAVAWDSVFG